MSEMVFDEQVYQKHLSEAIISVDVCGLPEMAPVVALFLEHFRPAKDIDNAACYLTSMEISNELEDICMVTNKDVALTMSFLGYRLKILQDEGPAWAMDYA